MMKIKIAIALASLAALSGCFGRDERPQLIKTEYTVVMPDDAYFTCEKVNLPDPDTLKDTQVAQLINDLVKANRVCHNNSVAIKTYLDKAKTTLEERK